MLAGLILRYCCFFICVLFTIFYVMSVEWHRITRWIPEQYWSLALLVMLYLYINPTYAWLVFWQGEQDDLYKFLQVFHAR